jgi:hypothetical protein
LHLYFNVAHLLCCTHTIVWWGSPHDVFSAGATTATPSGTTPASNSVGRSPHLTQECDGGTHITILLLSHSWITSTLITYCTSWRNNTFRRQNGSALAPDSGDPAECFHLVLAAPPDETQPCALTPALQLWEHKLLHGLAESCCSHGYHTTRRHEGCHPA